LTVPGFSPYSGDGVNQTLPFFQESPELWKPFFTLSSAVAVNLTPAHSAESLDKITLDRTTLTLARHYRADG